MRGTSNIPQNIFFNMVDMQKERLRHLVSNAILELWKKETGSLSSVLIEGTICITAGSGKTTVVQVHDKFSGSIPECGEESEDNLGRSGNKGLFSPRRTGLQHYLGRPPSVECKQGNAAAMQAYMDELSPASLVSPTCETPVGNSMSNDNNNNAERPTSGSDLQKSSGMDSGIDVNTTANEKSSMDFSINQLKDEFLSDDEEDSLNSSKNSTAGPVCPGTGYYTTTEGKEREGIKIKVEPNNNKRSSFSSIDKHVNNNKDISGLEGDFSISDGPGPLMSTPKPPKHSKMSCDVSPSSSLNESLNGGNALDLTKKEVDDLALSSPQNYTAQVRDVIRQRLLAHKGSISGSDDPQLDRDLEDSNTSDVKDEGSPTGILSRAKSFSELSSLPHFSASTMQHHANSLLRSHHHAASLLSSFPYPLFHHTGSSSSKGIRPSMPPSPHSFHEALNNSLKQHMPALIPLPVSGHERSSSVEPVNLAQDSQQSAEKGSSSTSGTNNEADKDTAGEQKVYKCDFCSKTFLFKSKYHEHLPVHTNARPFQCRLCSRTYKYKYDLRVHLRTHMGIPTKSTVCPFCNAKFDTNKLLRLHIKDAHRERHRVTEEDCAQLYEGVL